MQWFKHMSGSHEDPDIADAWKLHGDKAVVVFWVLLEIYAREWNRVGENGFLELTKGFMQYKFRCHWNTAHKILKFFSDRGRFVVKMEGDHVSIKIPKFIELASTWEKRKVTIDSTKQEPAVGNVSGTSGEVVKLKSFNDLPDEAKVKIADLAERLRACGYFGQQSKWSSPFQMIGAMLSRKYLPEAIIEALQALIDKRPETENYAFTVAKRRTDQLNYARSREEHEKMKRL